MSRTHIALIHLFQCINMKLLLKWVIRTCFHTHDIFNESLLEFIARNLLSLHSVTCHLHFIKGRTGLDLNVGGPKQSGPNKFRCIQINWPALNIGPVQQSSLDNWPADNTEWNKTTTELMISNSSKAVHFLCSSFTSYQCCPPSNLWCLRFGCWHSAAHVLCNYQTGARFSKKS